MFESITLNGEDVFTGDVLITEIRGLGSPSPRPDRIDRPRAHGAVDRTQFYGDRTIELMGVVGANTPTATWQAFDQIKGILARLANDEDVILRIGREGIGVERALVRVDADVDCNVLPNGIKWGVQLVAADPRFYSDVLKQGDYDPTVVGAGGVSFPMEFPFIFGQVQSGTVTVENQGNFKSPPAITIEGPVTDPAIDNETTGETITLDVTIIAGDELMIDVERRRTTLNGALRPDLIVPGSTTWWELIPGGNQIRLRGSAMVGGTTHLSIEFRDARI